MKIVIRDPNWIGDSVLAQPAIYSVGKNFPQAEIWIVVKEWTKDLFINLDFVRGIISLPEESDLKSLKDSAQKVLTNLGYTNIVFHIAEATLGWKIEAPYDAIIVTAGSPHIPDALLDQLATGGRMVIPVGSRHFQELCKIIKGTEKNHIQKLGGCRFVSLIGENAWEN